MLRRRAVLFTALGLALSLIVPTTAGAGQTSAATAKTVEVSSTGSYVVVMLDDPLLASFSQDQLGSPAAKAKGKQLKKGHDKALAEAGVATGAKLQDFTNALNGFSAIMTHDQAVALASSKSVARVIPDELRQKTTDSSPAYLGLTGNSGAAWDTGLTGEGVIVGVIDTGIWPEHPSFADDGSYPSLGITLDTTNFAACDFGNTAHNANDAPFTCNNKLIGARQILPTYRALIGADADEFDSARDDDGHGTHTASTAAGNRGVAATVLGRSVGTVSGIAPRARVIAYKALGNLGGFTSDLAAAIDQAVEDGVDVINYSIGGGASLAGADEIAFLFAADAGVFVATSAGNSGPGAGTVGGPGTVPWLTTVAASTQPRFFEGKITLGNNSMPTTGASITGGTAKLPLVDAESAGGDLCIPGTLDSSKVAGKIVLCRRGAIARAAKSLAVYQAGGAGMILYNNVDSDNLFTDTHWVPSVHIDNTPGLAVKSYIAKSTNPTAQITTGTVGKWKPTPSLTIFSSRGPDVVAEDIIKPDITAPGLQILAGASPYPEAGSVPGELFQAIAGTSMSSPHVAGMFALLKQAHPDWTSAMARSAIMTTANPNVIDNDRSSKANPFGTGSGHLNPGRATQAGSAFNPGLVYDAGLLDYVAFLCGTTTGVVSGGFCNALVGAGYSIDPSNLNYPSIGIAQLAGSETVTRTATNVAPTTETYRASTVAPPGYSVNVSPATMVLAPGQSGTFEVTITNTGSAPAGEWRFGALTWKSGKYEARSPIAVKGSPFNAPASVTGSGASGSGSFDVLFGYTGAYTAGNHGLSADAPTSDSIGQDPDQTYPSPDDSTAGVQKIPFSLSGVAFARWTLAIPGNDDIDLFLENSSGQIIASSTNGGTDEKIELLLPADGNYTMVVHGWSVPNAPLAYTLHYWAVPLATGGSLSIDSAPASATTGASGTVAYSWSGLASGEYLGAVSHSDGAGLLGLTLVEITSP